MKKLTILALMQNTFCFRRQFLAYPFRIGLGDRLMRLVTISVRAGSMARSPAMGLRTIIPRASPCKVPWPRPAASR